MSELTDEMQRKSILLVDDVGSVRSLCKGFLRELGFERIEEAVDGKAAVQYLRHHAVDLVICDWNMPHMNGFELLEAVRQDPNIHDMPFLMITGTSDVERVKQAIAAGVSDYILKPFKPSQLGFKVARALTDSQHQSAARMEAAVDEPEEAAEPAEEKPAAAASAEQSEQAAQPAAAEEEDLDISADAVAEEQAAGKN